MYKSLVAGARLVADPSLLNFLHVAQTSVNAGDDVVDLYWKMTSSVPGWLSFSFKVRDFISGWFGVRKIDGFSCARGAVPEKGDYLDFFRVEDVCSRRLVLSAIDRHLGVMVDMEILPADEGMQGKHTLRLVTSVKTFNLYGRMYMVPVAPMHGRIVQTLFENLGDG